MNQKSNTFVLAMCGLAIAINVVLGSVIANLHILLYLDTIGTVFIAVAFGPWAAFVVGLLTNVISGITAGPTDIPFGIVNGAVGLVSGYIARRFGFGLITSIITGVILSVVAPLIGTPIAIAVYGGLTGSATDVLVLWLRHSGEGIFTAAFLPRIGENVIDKIATCILVSYLIKQLPSTLRNRFSQMEQTHAAQ